MGDLVLYSEQNKVFSEGIRVQNASDYESLFSFGSLGWQSIKKGSIEYYQAPEKIFVEQRIDTEDLKILNAFPSGIILSNSKSIYFIRKLDEGFKSTIIKNSFEQSTLIGACDSFCDLWLFDGEKLSIGKLVNNAISWSEMDYKFKFEKDKVLKNLYFKIKENGNGEAEVVDAAAYEDGILYLLNKGKSEDSDFSWNSLQLLSDEYCIPCHSEDGFHLEATWAVLRDEMIRRMDGSEGVNPMPPPETDYGKKMTQSSKSSIISYLENNVESKSGSGFGNNDDTPEIKIDGKLKQLAGDYSCTGCHAEAVNESWWKLNKEETASRIMSGDMPRNRSLNDTQKNELITLIRAL